MPSTKATATDAANGTRYTSARMPRAAHGRPTHRCAVVSLFRRHTPFPFDLSGSGYRHCQPGLSRRPDSRAPVGGLVAGHPARPAGSVRRGMSDPIVNRSPFLDAALGRPARHTPVWFMRQAGRSLPEYRAVRGEGSILDAIKQPDLAAEITLQPVRRYGVDAAVLYSDIVVPAHAVGLRHRRRARHRAGGRRSVAQPRRPRPAAAARRPRRHRLRGRHRANCSPANCPPRCRCWRSPAHRSRWRAT